MGTLILLRGGIPFSVSPSILSVPFTKLLIAFTQDSLVEYTKLPSIQLVIVFCCSRGMFGLCPVLLSYPALWKGINLSPFPSLSYISSPLIMGILCISIGHPASLARRISADTTCPKKVCIAVLFLRLLRPSKPLMNAWLRFLGLGLS